MTYDFNAGDKIQLANGVTAEMIELRDSGYWHARVLSVPEGLFAPYVIGLKLIMTPILLRDVVKL